MKLQIGSQVFKLSTTFPFLIAMICIAIIVLLINSSRSCVQGHPR